MGEKTRFWHDMQLSGQGRSRLKLLALLLSLAVLVFWAASAAPVSAQDPSCGDSFNPSFDPPDFYIVVVPASQTVEQGGMTTYEVSVNTTNCYTGTVTLSVAGLPDDASHAFDPADVVPPADSNLTVQTTASTPPGTYVLTISGDSGTLHREASVELVVNEPPPPDPDFTIAASPASQSVDPGGQADYVVSLDALGGFSDTVSLSVTGLPTGADAAFDPDALVPPGDSALAITTGADTPPGTYMLTISGDSGTLHHEASVELVVNEPVQQTVVGVSPAAGSMFVGETAQSQILLSNGSNFYGVEFFMTYDPAVLQVVDADPATDGVQIALGDLFPPEQYAVGVNRVDTEAGLISFGVARRSPAPPVNGDGVLAVITWEAVGEGTSDLDFTHLKIADPSGFEREATSQGGTMSVTLTGLVSGQVHLQGRLDHSGAEVSVSPTGLEAITDIEGLFSFLTHGTLTITARMYGYLDAEATVELSPGESVDLGLTTLYGGEVTGDNCIDILDLAYLGARFHSDDLSADINGDGLVDILDLAMAAANFLMCGPTPWE